MEIIIIEPNQVFGLYKGLTSPLIGLTFMNAIIFGVHGNLYRLMQPGVKAQFIAGTAAGIVQSLIVCPVELAKIKLQIQGEGVRFNKNQRTFVGPFDCLRNIVKSQGMIGCFRGMTITVMRDGPGYGAYFAVYHSISCSFVPHGRTVADLGQFPILLSGGLAGMISWAVVYPLDVVKSRIQAEGKYKSNWECIVQSYSKDGLGVFTRGLPITMCRAFPVSAAIFPAYTLSYRFLDALTRDRENL